MREWHGVKVIAGLAKVTAAYTVGFMAVTCPRLHLLRCNVRTKGYSNLTRFCCFLRIRPFNRKISKPGLNRTHSLADLCVRVNYGENW